MLGKIINAACSHMIKGTEAHGEGRVKVVIDYVALFYEHAQYCHAFRRRGWALVKFNPHSSTQLLGILLYAAF